MILQISLHDDQGNELNYPGYKRAEVERSIDMWDIKKDNDIRYTDYDSGDVAEGLFATNKKKISFPECTSKEGYSYWTVKQFRITISHAGYTGDAKPLFDGVTRPSLVISQGIAASFMPGELKIDISLIRDFLPD